MGQRNAGIAITIMIVVALLDLPSVYGSPIALSNFTLSFRGIARMSVVASKTYCLKVRIAKPFVVLAIYNI